MELADERLIDVVLGNGHMGSYCHWPRRTRTEAPGLAGLKSRLKRIWMAGDHDRLSRYLEPAAADFFKRLSVPRGSRLLDVGCGSGQFALIASRNGIAATGIDIAENLVERARERARIEQLDAQFRVADAEALPFADSSFDFVTSLTGAMFAPRPDVVAGELLRVCRPGGTIAMTNWTAQGFIGKLMHQISGFIAPPGMPDPALWGDESMVRERLGPGTRGVRIARGRVEFSFPFPPAEVVRFFREYHGPANRAFASLNRAGRKVLQANLEALWSEYNVARDGLTRVDAEWLEVIAVRA